MTSGVARLTLFGLIKTSLGCALGPKAIISNDSGYTDGMSLALCTAISISPFWSFSSSSSVKTPLEPILEMATSKMRSPWVDMGASSEAMPSLASWIFTQ